MTSQSVLTRAIQLIREGRDEDALVLHEPLSRDAQFLEPVHLLRIDVLIRTGRRREARDAHEEAVSLQLASPNDLDALAFFARQLDYHKLSNSLYRQATKLAPHDARFWYNLATSERTLGRLDGAAATCEAALAIEPDMRPAVLLRFEVIRATPDSNRTEELRRRIAQAGDGPDAMFLFFALGKELHDLGEFDLAFKAFASGARRRRQTLNYDVARDEAKLSADEANVAHILDRRLIAQTVKLLLQIGREDRASL